MTRVVISGGGRGALAQINEEVSTTGYILCKKVSVPFLVDKTPALEKF